MMNRIELKTKAKESLEGKYGDAIGIVLLLFAISFLAGGGVTCLKGIFHLTENSYAILTNVVSVVLSGLFTFGYTSYFLKVSREEDVEISELWSKMNLFIPYLVVTIFIALFTTL